eukprot:647697-Pelagomonas_calceolata.AAC.5
MATANTCRICFLLASAESVKYISSALHTLMNTCSYKRDEEGWRTMFYSYLDFCKAPNAGSTGGSHGVARAMRGRKRGGRGRGRGSTSSPKNGILSPPRVGDEASNTHLLSRL